MTHEYMLYVTFVASKSFYGTRTAIPRKMCKFRLSRNTTKFYVLARFHETIPTVKSISSSEINRINSGFLTEIIICNRNYDFTLFPEIGISRVLHYPLLKRNFVPKFRTITITHMHMQRALYHACKQSFKS